MKTLFLLLLFCHLSSPVMHSLKYFITGSTGLPDFPKLVATTKVDQALLAYCDTNRGEVEPAQDWVKKIFIKYPQILEYYINMCFETLPNLHNDMAISLMRLFNQSGGVHVTQRMAGCEWDDETGEVNGFFQHGYDGENFMSLDPKTLKWIAMKPQVVNLTLALNADKNEEAALKVELTEMCPNWLKIYVDFGRSFLLRTVLPSVSLLQKTPSSPVSCHATGFYPDRAALFWRKDGEEIHEEVDHGEILPNQDGTFQMRVDLNLSSVRPEDWRSYDCVFQLAAVKDDIVTKLDKDKIRTNWVDPPETNNTTVFIIAAVVVLALTLIIATGFIIYKRREANSPPSSPDTIAELSEHLNDLNAQETDKTEDREGYHLTSME